MKFQNLRAFEKHLIGALPHDLARVILVVSPQESERKELMRQIAALIPWEPIRIDVGSLLDQLQIRPMLESHSLVLCDGADQLPKQVISELTAYALSPSPCVYLILGVSSFKSVSELYQTGKKEIVALDLSEEKPWDKEKRLKASLEKRAEQEGFFLPSETSSYLLESIGHDLVGLEAELAKLICYVGEKRRLELSDAQEICIPRALATTFQIAEGIVWRGERLKEKDLLDESLLFSLIGPLRYHLQLAAQICSYQLCQDTEWERAFPTLRAASLQKYIPICTHRGATFFYKKLLKLFELEFAAKSSSVHIGLVWRQFLELA